MSHADTQATVCRRVNQCVSECVHQRVSVRLGACGHPVNINLSRWQSCLSWQQLFGATSTVVDARQQTDVTIL